MQLLIETLNDSHITPLFQLGFASLVRPGKPPVVVLRLTTGPADEPRYYAVPSAALTAVEEALSRAVAVLRKEAALDAARN